MTSSSLCCLLLTVGAAPASDASLAPPTRLIATPSTSPMPAPYGWLYQSAYSFALIRREPAEPYQPQPGDIIFYTDYALIWKLTFGLAGTSHPYHSGIVVRMPNGELRTLEAGWNDERWVRLTPMPRTMQMWHASVWFRRRRQPLTEHQSALLTQFAQSVNWHHYSLPRLAAQLTPLRSRGPLRTRFIGRPHGIRRGYICSECVLEAMVYSGLLDRRTTRPAATYPRDFFMDRSLNPYINRHLDLSCCYWPPQLWTCSVPDCSGCCPPIPFRPTVSPDASELNGTATH